MTAMPNSTPSAVGFMVSSFIASLSLTIETTSSRNAMISPTVGK
jgi:hypothetical protein